MPTRTIQLTEDLNQFLESAVESGRVNDASQAVSEALRLLEDREAEDRAKLWNGCARRRSRASTRSIAETARC